MSADTLRERYSRAVRLTAPKAAAQRPGLAVEGYWLDEKRYYFLAEKFDSALDRIVATPSIADGETRQVREVISLEALANLLSANADERVDLQALSCATFDMPDRHTLAVSVAGRDYLVDARGRRI